jgi:hypothetical protein
VPPPVVWPARAPGRWPRAGSVETRTGGGRVLAIRIRGLSTPWFIVGMAIASVVAALIAGRISLVEGRWLLSFDTVLDYPLA